VQVELKKSQTTKQKIDLGALRTKLLRRLDRLRKLQATYTPAAIVALEKREAVDDEQPENKPLYLPTALSEAERADGGCVSSLLKMELLMQDAQCRSALVKLRNQLVIKAQFLNYKALHAHHQGATTHAHGIVNRNEVKIRLHSEKYQNTWNTLWVNAGCNKSLVAWRKLRKEDIRCMEDKQDLAAKKERWRKAIARQRMYNELVAHAVKIPVWLNNNADEEEEETQVGESQRDGGMCCGSGRRQGVWGRIKSSRTVSFYFSGEYILTNLAQSTAY
jgi:hypothetical protein